MKVCLERVRLGDVFVGYVLQLAVERVVIVVKFSCVIIPDLRGIIPHLVYICFHFEVAIINRRVQVYFELFCF
ncbi:MAG: hypothetical protein RBG13Loki_0429 [Promethearchaeota archaeon CR_4]|nr:MAG: hypothetical protein RBG13Loki_0429 [Candidatus Lokiarchaeota archaeon CR_4]